jgi:ELP3 family radical SAM enzyme/protein acetyltransferase
MDIENIGPINKFEYTDEQVFPFVEDLIKSFGSPDHHPSEDDLDIIFRTLRRKFRILPSKTQIRNIYEKNFKKININNELKRWMIKRVMRSESGVIVVTIVTKPGDKIKFSCPEKCAYCPTETDLNGVPTQPKSYISTEPAMARAARHNFDIRRQIIDRIRAYLYTGNIKKDSTKKKIEVILSGGTWDVMPKQYRDSVINEIYYTFNTILNKDERQMLSIPEEIKINETAIFGVIGLTIETRPDYVTNKALLEYLDYGVTRVQLGGQSTHDDILLKIKRGCLTKNMIHAIRLLKGIGMKVVTHWMPDLPGSSKERDIQMFDELLSNPDLQSDDWKIYPCAIVKSHSPDRIVTSDINKWYDEGSFKPYSEANIQDLIDVCIHFKKKINPWIRIERLVRDIPTQSIEAGYSKITNLRDIIKNKGIVCKCIRCMEIKDRVHLINESKIVVRKYEASKGIEYHISLEVEKNYWNIKYIIHCIWSYINKLFGRTIYYSGNYQLYNGLFGFLRLRIDPNPGLDIVPEIKNAGLIREVHVYGMSTSVGDNIVKSSQHKGVGQRLMSVAEDIVKQHNLNKVAVISGIGSREYYKNKCGYHLDSHYMTKYL